MSRIGLVVLLSGVMLAGMASVGHAKDVSAQQAGVELAREAWLKAEAAHQTNLKKVAEAEQALTEAQQHLEQERKQAAASKVALEQAKARLDQAQANLDRAWKAP
ncbi:MAG: hypothetical protein Fur0040_07640 [Sideroxydans sp.]